MTGAMIKLPEDPASQQEETIVEIFGNFMATQVRDQLTPSLNGLFHCCQGHVEKEAVNIMQTISVILSTI